MTKTINKVPMTIYTPEPLKVRLKKQLLQISYKRGDIITMSELMEQIIEEYLEREEARDE